MKKCLVLDLDNTLWGGVVGEDGFLGIKLGLEQPGSYFLAFQQAILDLANVGIILAINSKNNEQDALEVIKKHPNMVLKENHFAARRINWNDKATNLRELAAELNIGLDSIVFLDDDPINRALVRAELPEVETPDLPADPSQYAKFLMLLPYFPKDALTDEDNMRGAMYVTERLRTEFEKRFTSKEDFFHSLGIEVDCHLDDPECLPRLAQLTEKTNQFNSKKMSIGEADILRYIADPGYAVFHARARDKFGDHGVIAFALVKKAPELKAWIIESLLMSCRVLGKGVEEAFISKITETAYFDVSAPSVLRIYLEKTAKNQPAQDFIKKYFINQEFALKSNLNLSPKWILLNLIKPASRLNIYG